MPPKPKKKPSPLRKDPKDRAQIVSTSVPPAVKDWLTEIGGGKLTAGMRNVLIAAYHQQAQRNPDKS
jgi:hypothetical protein